MWNILKDLFCPIFNKHFCPTDYNSNLTAQKKFFFFAQHAKLFPWLSRIYRKLAISKSVVIPDWKFLKKAKYRTIHLLLVIFEATVIKKYSGIETFKNVY